MGQLFQGNGPTGSEGLAPVVVFLGLGLLGLTRRHLGLHAIDIAVQAAYLAHCTGQLGFGGLQPDFGIAGVELDQHLPGMHQITVVGTDTDHSTGHQRGDFHDVAVDIGIVGLFIPAPVQLVPGPDCTTTDDHQQSKAKQPGFAFTGVVEVLRCAGTFRRVHLAPIRWAVRVSPAASSTLLSRFSRVASSSAASTPTSSFIAAAPICGN
ncbi:hypothetical protein D3C84_729570 [compost metagenome]